MFDTLIRGGAVIDGTGRPAFAADVAVSGGRLAAIGERAAACAAQEVGEGCTQRRRKCAVLSAEQHNADTARAVTQMRLAAGDGDRYLKGVRSGENERRHHGDAHDSF